MKLTKLSLLSLFLLVVLIGCGGRLTVKDAKESGARQLTGHNIDRLITGKTLHIVNWDKSVEADVTFSEGGKLSGKNNLGNQTDGRWRISKENMLCVRYDQWASADMRCYSVFKMDDEFKMFRADGGLDSNFTVVGGYDGEVVYSNVGLGQSMPGSSASRQTTSAAKQQVSKKEKQQASWWKPQTWFDDDEPELEPVRPVTTTGGNFASQQEMQQENQQGSWWKPQTWFDDDELELAPVRSVATAGGDFVVPAVAPQSAEVRHLLEDKECIRCELSDEDFHDAELKKADLENANLANANFSGADLRDANLKNASLSGVNLSNANLEGANLAGANLEGANLEGANLEDADFTGAVLFKARLVDAILQETILKNANLENANLHWADLTEADLRSANMKGAYLVKATFYKADLTGAVMDDVVVQRTNFNFAKGYTPIPTGEGTVGLGQGKEDKKKFLGLF